MVEIAEEKNSPLVNIKKAFGSRTVRPGLARGEKTSEKS